jgi:hypothetical protein
MKTQLAFALTLIILVSCGKDSSSSTPSNGKDSDQVQGGEFVDFDKIPERYMKDKEAVMIQTQNVSELDINLHGFKSDVRIKYGGLPSQTAMLEIYRVYDRGVNSETVTNYINDTISIRSGQRNYQCMITTENGLITSLEGNCIVRIVLTLSDDVRVQGFILSIEQASDTHSEGAGRCHQ